MFKSGICAIDPKPFSQTLHRREGMSMKVWVRKNTNEK
jgi:hypothetical protein